MEIKVTITIDDGEIKDVKVDKIGDESKSLSREYSEYARFFDEGNPNWSRDPKINLFYLKHVQSHMNATLQCRGHLFLNEVYDALGIPRSKIGQYAGWTYDKGNPLSDNHVDFGLSDMDLINDNGCAFEGSILLDFNVEGNIEDYLP